MSEFFNQNSSIPGRIPSGLFNAMFGFDGYWAADAAKTKFMGLDGCFISVFDVHIDRYPLVLSDEVRNAVPITWDPSALARFIETYGTHIIVGLSVGGEDVVLFRQDKSSNLDPSDLKKHLQNLADQLFIRTRSFSQRSRSHRAPQAFNIFDQQQLVTINPYSSISAKDGITVICRKKGGDLSVSSHYEWLPTVASNPDATHFKFIPITSLLNGIPGSGFLGHAVNLYVRYKPPISDLRFFLDFQSPKTWAPKYNDLPLGSTTNMANISPALNFSLMSPKLKVNTTRVIVRNRPVTGIKFYLEGMKGNRLAIHLQHLSDTPTMFKSRIDETSLWRGSEESNDIGFIKAIYQKRFSHVCTAPVKYNPKWTMAKDGAYIVTGAQLHVKQHGWKNVLHLQLLYSRVSNFFIAKSQWDHGSLGYSQNFSGLLSSISTSIPGANPEKSKPPKAVVVNSALYPSGPPPQPQKLLKFVDISELCRGPQDSPGHWLVTGAKLDLERGKICLQVKFSLLNICSSL
ncbi:MACPF domain-containing protein At1g14780-like isoform X2 [Mercurialis annua]|nr:MACPF domain-containing protein At1g14780-like isoform X2 [Mercurialis annua]